MQYEYSIQSCWVRLRFIAKHFICICWLSHLQKLFLVVWVKAKVPSLANQDHWMRWLREQSQPAELRGELCHSWGSASGGTAVCNQVCCPLPVLLMICIHPPEVRDTVTAFKLLFRLINLKSGKRKTCGYLPQGGRAAQARSPPGHAPKCSHGPAGPRRGTCSGTCPPPRKVSAAGTPAPRSQEGPWTGGEATAPGPGPASGGARRDVCSSLPRTGAPAAPPRAPARPLVNAWQLFPVNCHRGLHAPDVFSWEFCFYLLLLLLPLWTTSVSFNLKHWEFCLLALLFRCSENALAKKMLQIISHPLSSDLLDGLLALHSWVELRQPREH